MSGSTIALPSVKSDTHGIPVAAGINRRAVRLGSAVGLTTGSALTLVVASGASTSYVVESVSAMTADQAAAAVTAARQSGGLVVLVPVGEGSWSVAVAR